MTDKPGKGAAATDDVPAAEKDGAATGEDGAATAEDVAATGEDATGEDAAGEAPDKAAEPPQKLVLDVAIAECEFASPFAYFLELELEGHAERRWTDISQPSARPIFTNSSLLLAAEGGVTGKKLKVSAFLNVVDPSSPGAEPTAKLLGAGLVSLDELKVAEGATTSKSIVRNVSFLRQVGDDASAEGKNLVVGRTTVALQVKALPASEVERSALFTQTAPHTSLSTTGPSLDKSLWAARPFEQRIRVLVHRADFLPVPDDGSRATLRLAVRLLQGGNVLHEVATANLPISPMSVSGSDLKGEVIYNQEVVLPLPGDIAGLKVSMALEMVGPNSYGSIDTSSLLDLNWSAMSLPALSPLHLYARTSEDGSTVPSFSRPRPRVLVSLTREAAHEALDEMGERSSHGTEIRVHGISQGRPLPAAAESSIVAICPESSPGGEDPRIPVATYYWDQRTDLDSFIESHFNSGAALQYLKCFLTPAAGLSRAPQWGQFVVRCVASNLKSLSILLFENGLRADPDVPLGGTLLGFTTLDATTLLGSSQPTSRSFLLDLRCLEAPGASPSLEVEVRVWPRGGVPAGLPVVDETTRPAGPSAMVRHADKGATPATAGTAMSAGAVMAALDQEGNDFRLNHELSVQLAKEFNLRAAALKRAGEEVVTLRRQVQMLKNENASLRAQIEDEEKLAEDVRQRPPPEGLENLSGAELAMRLQRSLEKYREEKAKAAELGRRLEEAMKQAARGRSLERSLEELQQAHLEQNRELQRLQDEGRKLETYRQTTRTQEKVISKLEKILESSLQEVQKAQKVQVDVEKLKTENLRLRERCSSLLSKKKSDGSAAEEDSQDSRRKLAQKDAEVIRLQAIVKDLKAGDGNTTSGEEATRQSANDGTLNDLEAKRLDWEQKCKAAEQRLQMLQRQLTESSKKYGSEISDYKVEIAKKDAHILELEYLLKRKDEDGG